MRAWMLGGMRVPLLLAVLLLASALAVPVPLGEREEGSRILSSDWRIEVVDSVGDVGWHTSIAVDGSGYPHVSYFDATNESLKYAKWTGSNWSIGTVDTDGRVGLYSSIALDSKGDPHISYSDSINQERCYSILPRINHNVVLSGTLP